GNTHSLVEHRTRPAGIRGAASAHPADKRQQRGASRCGQTSQPRTDRLDAGYRHRNTGRRSLVTGAGGGTAAVTGAESVAMATRPGAAVTGHTGNPCSVTECPVEC